MNNLYEIYLKCFPSLAISEERFDGLVKSDGVKTFEEDGGFALTDGSGVLLLCCLAEKRGRGIGSRLLAQCEEEIRSSGRTRATLGLGEGYLLFQGVPMTDADSFGFFERRGYIRDGETVDMEMPLSGFTHTLPPPEGVEFRYASAADREELMAAVAEVDEDWCMYFSGMSDEIFLAVCGGRIVGFCFAEKDMDVFGAVGGRRTGGVGCVGVVPSARSRGVGLAMVDAATEELKRVGCEASYIAYTHLEGWYAKLGYRTIMRFTGGHKSLAE